MYGSEGARLRELALMAQKYAEQNQPEKAEEVLRWAATVGEMKELQMATQRGPKKEDDTIELWQSATKNRQ